HDAEDERQAARQQEQEGAVRKAVEGLRDPELAAHAGSGERAARATPSRLVMRRNSTMKDPARKGTAARGQGAESSAPPPGAKSGSAAPGGDVGAPRVEATDRAHASRCERGWSG